MNANWVMGVRLIPSNIHHCGKIVIFKISIFTSIIIYYSCLFWSLLNFLTEDGCY